jgi:hypothetical protein
MRQGKAPDAGFVRASPVQGIAFLPAAQQKGLVLALAFLPLIPYCSHLYPRLHVADSHPDGMSRYVNSEPSNEALQKRDKDHIAKEKC